MARTLDFFVTTGPCNEDTCAIGPIVREDAIQPRGMGISLSWPDFGNSAGSGRPVAYRWTINNGLSPLASRFPMIYRPAIRERETG